MANTDHAGNILETIDCAAHHASRDTSKSQKQGAKDKPKAKTNEDLAKLMAQIRQHRAELQKLLIRAEDLRATIEVVRRDYEKVVTDRERRKTAN